MFNWIQNHTRLEYITELEPFDFSSVTEQERIRRMEPQEQPAEMTALAQYFIAASAWLTENMSITIPMRNEEAAKRVLEEVSPHFNKVLQYTAADRGSGIVLQKLKPASKALFGAAGTAALPLMEDLYRHHDIGVWDAGKRSIVNYSVNRAELEPCEGPEIEKLQALLHKLYLDPPGEDFGLAPLGWKFEDSLKDSLMLRFLAGFTPHLTLAVDSGTMEVISIHLSQEEFSRPVLLRSGWPKPPRRNGDYLYLDLGRKLVYVVDLSKQAKLETWADLHEEARVYHIPPDGDFARFNHLTAEPKPAGVGLFFDTNTIGRILETINLELESF
ncbi:hypothetical protein QW71_24610 [Paenibacillus sp. IHB B 3415]|uniref:hypothetical protein n=1 Tax=Paenibacillus sp. IHB B 3415 TaxID=867080 RepID=UPI0005732A85|nr:hypothetical protein [Paenibacillus sp. IHB B 3415]KHL93298.1 hypothetical protein QW71_24610 [Paenibacillus sp. IHB B 3415]